MTNKVNSRVVQRTRRCVCPINPLLATPFSCQVGEGEYKESILPAPSWEEILHPLYNFHDFVCFLVVFKVICMSTEDQLFIIVENDTARSDHAV